jgi:Smg protein
MVNRLIDLVVLVAELSEHRGKSLKELDEELLGRGYSPKEIEQAIFWLSSQRRSAISCLSASGRPAHRVLSPWEAMCLDSDAYGYLLHLQNLGIIDQDQFEQIVTRIMPIGGEKLPLGELKTLAGSIIFNLGGDDYEDEAAEGIPDPGRIN